MKASVYGREESEKNTNNWISTTTGSVTDADFFGIKYLISGASVRLGHKSLRTLMKRSSSWYLPGDLSILLSPGTKNLPFPCQKI